LNNYTATKINSGVAIASSAEEKAHDALGAHYLLSGKVACQIMP
jgi:hypothetical protein